MRLLRLSGVIKYRRRAIAVVGVASVVLTLGWLFLPPAPPAQAQPDLRAAPSDSRATFFLGNVTACAQVNLPNSIQMGSTSNTSASDANVTGTVKTNAGTIQPGVGQEVNVAINAAASVTIDAVVVKASNGYNVYSNPTVLPPTLPPDQHYISPLTGTGANVPAISHWFVCYHLTTPPPAGSLIVTKTVIPPDGTPVTQLPTTYTAVVNCTDPDFENITVTFGAGGGVGTPALTGIPTGTVCTVVENTVGLPPGTGVGYEPPGAETNPPGVTISATAAVEVNITNDFTSDPVQVGTLQLAKTVTNPSGVTAPQTFTAQVVCVDGTNATVTMPGTGGPGTPVLHPPVGTVCGIEETSVPAGWTVTYAVNGGTASTDLPKFVITSATDTVTITINNAAPTSTTTTASTTTTTAPTTTTTGPTTTTSAPTTSTSAPTTTTSETVLAEDVTPGSTTTVPSGTSTGAGSLPTTGRDLARAIRIGLSALLVGIFLLLLGMRPAQSQPTPQHRRRSRSD
jgi:hypothetical protein